MKRMAALSVVLAGLVGCVSTDSKPDSMPAYGSGAGYRPSVPGVQGPWGQPVSMVAPYTSKPPSGAQLAQAMMNNSVPLAMVQPGAAANRPSSSDIVQAGAWEAAGDPTRVHPPGVTPPVPFGPPGVPVGPGGIMPAKYPVPPLPVVPNAVAAVGAITGPNGPRFPTRRTEVRFVGPAGMKVSWPGPYGEVRGNQIEAPGRYNFIQGAIYRLKLSDLPGRPGVDLYPTLEVIPANLRTDAYIAHSAVPLYFTDEDFEQVLGGNFLVKVIYLPNPQYADVAMTGGPEEVVSTRLEPGLDPIAEACKRGTIMLIIRMGNIDLEAPNTPPMDAPNPYGAGGGPGCQAQGPGPMPPGAMAMQNRGGPALIPLGPLVADGKKDDKVAKGGKKPGVSAADLSPDALTNSLPVSRLPDTAPSVQPVRYQESTTAPTPAQAASQGK